MLFFLVDMGNDYFMVAAKDETKMFYYNDAFYGEYYARTMMCWIKIELSTGQLSLDKDFHELI